MEGGGGLDFDRILDYGLLPKPRFITRDLARTCSWYKDLKKLSRLSWMEGGGGGIRPVGGQKTLLRSLTKAQVYAQGLTLLDNHFMTGTKIL